MSFLVLFGPGNPVSNVVWCKEGLKGCKPSFSLQKVENRTLTCCVATNTDYYEMLLLLLLLLLLMLLLFLIKLSLFIRVEHEQK